MGVFLLHRVLTKKISTGFEPFDNKFFAVEFVQIIHIISIASMGACKLLFYLWKAIYGRLFLFSGVIRKYNRSSSRYGLEINMEPTIKKSIGKWKKVKKIFLAKKHSKASYLQIAGLRYKN